jgi:ubiquinone biosynthesis protein
LTDRGRALSLLLAASSWLAPSLPAVTAASPSTRHAPSLHVARLFVRALVIAWVIALGFGAYIVERIGGRGDDDGDRERLRGEVLTRVLARLGATFVKFGQILATRPDIIPEGITRELARLQDGVPPAPFAEVSRVIDEELSSRARDAIARIDPVPVAAASVAQVHRGTLVTGEVVAIKVQRLAAEAQIERDLALLSGLARLVGSLPGMRYMSIPGAVARFADALRAQLDFREEAANNRRLARNFAKDPKVRVPALYDALCSRRVLTMEFIDGVRPTDVRDDRAGLAMAGFRCITQMVFLDGFVHADMHPGNVMFTRDGRIVLIDLGLVAEIEESMRKPWVDTYVAIATCDGPRAAELFYGYAPTVATEDYDAYVADITRHLESMKGKPLHELEVTEAVGGAMALLRKHRVQVDPVFTVVNLAMLVAEGVGKQLDPHFDVFSFALPVLMEAMARYPTGKGPVRPIPGRRKALAAAAL